MRAANRVERLGSRAAAQALGLTGFLGEQSGVEYLVSAGKEHVKKQAAGGRGGGSAGGYEWVTVGLLKKPPRDMANDLMVHELHELHE